MSAGEAALSQIKRLAAAVIAVIAIAGIVIYADAQMGKSGTFGDTLWVLLRYFTITTNVLIVLVFGALAAGAAVSQRLVAGTVLFIALVGVIYDLLLQGLGDLTAGAAIANVLLHRVTPIVGVVFWLLAAPKGQLRWIDPLLWALYPLGYLVYALVRGAAEGIYAYPFLDVGRFGAAAVSFNSVVIAAGFVVAGLLMVALDRFFAERSKRPI
jgi:hypothetical protein